MTEALLEKLRPICEAADQAFRSDPTYVTDMAVSASAMLARQAGRSVDANGARGVSPM